MVTAVEVDIEQDIEKVAAIAPATPEIENLMADWVAHLESCLDSSLDNQLTALDEALETLADVILDQVEDLIPFADYADRPIDFAHEILGIKYLTHQQHEILESLKGRTITNVRAAAGIGKSFVAAIAVIFWVFAVGGRCVSTAPSSSQLDEILWSEIRGMYDKNKLKLGGRAGRLFLRLTESARATGFTAKDYDSNSFHGKHHEKLLLILDEACGISREIDDAAMACITGSQNRLLRIGNPISDGNAFSEACARSSLAIPAWIHPNVSWAYEIDPEDGVHRLKADVAERILKPIPEGAQIDDPVLPQDLWPDDLPRDVIPGAVSIGWIEMMRMTKGERSPFWQSRIEAHFPEDAVQSIVPRSWFWSAVARFREDPKFWFAEAQEYTPRHGLDVGDGGDPHAWAMMRGHVLVAAEEKATYGDRLDVSRAALWGLNKLKQHGGTMAVDQIGVGAGALSDIMLKIDEDSKLSSMAAVEGINFGLSTTEDDTMLNVRAESYWNFRELFRRGQIVVAIEDEEVLERLADELAKSYYEETTKGTRMEEKKKTRKRLKRSPNLADAAVMSSVEQDDGALGGNQWSIGLAKESDVGTAIAIEGYGGSLYFQEPVYGFG